jgi:pyruvate kinase
MGDPFPRRIPVRATKIVATVGPASGPEAVLRELIHAGADVFRLNFSHGTREEHRDQIRTLRALREETGRSIGILADLQGPKIRLGTFEHGFAVLRAGAVFTITVDPVVGNAERASTTYPGFARDVRAGDRVLLNDGAVGLRVLDTDGTAARCEVVSGGPVGDRKGINLPGVRVSAPSFGEKDKEDLRLALREGADIVALSFVRRPDDIRELRAFLEENGAHLPVVAKLETPEGWENLDAILDVSDGVMVARGDLGVEMALEKVPFIQKSTILRARRRGRFVITATQMLESMMESPVPTRAEVSDVANAIYDGTDAVMLSGETSIGRHPLEAVRTMERIAEETDGALKKQGFPEWPEEPEQTKAEIVAQAAYRAARSASVAAVAVFTMSGFTARLVARYRPRVPVFAFTPSVDVFRGLSVVYGVRPVGMPSLTSTDDILAHLDRTLSESGWLAAGDTVVVVAGLPAGRPGNTNLMKLHKVGELR